MATLGKRGGWIDANGAYDIDSTAGGAWCCVNPAGTATIAITGRAKGDSGTKGAVLAALEIDGGEALVPAGMDLTITVSSIGSNVSVFVGQVQAMGPLPTGGRMS